MPNYVALLRAINVGGKNVIKMEALRDALETAGFKSVVTFIQSGNVIFESGLKDIAKLEAKLSRTLKSAFGYVDRIILRDSKGMRSTVENFPTWFKRSDWKHHVIFLTPELDDKGVLDRFVIKEGIEKIAYSRGVLYWSAKKDALGRSTLIKLSARKEYKAMTVRNVNTTIKVYELLGKRD